MNVMNTIAAAAVTMMQDVKLMPSTLPPTPWRDCLGTPVQPGTDYKRMKDGSLRRTDDRGTDRFMRRNRSMNRTYQPTARSQRRGARAQRFIARLQFSAKPAATRIDSNGGVQ